MPVAAGLAQVRRDNANVTDKLLNAGADTWVVDTGSGHHLVAEKDLSRDELATLRKAKKVLKLSTANGFIKSKLVATVWVRMLDKYVEARVLEGTPRVLSVERLVKDFDARLAWDARGCNLEFGNSIIELIVEQGVPNLALPVTSSRERGVS